MLARQRQELILGRVQSRGGVRVSELVEVLGVSEMTVRRDIAELAGRGAVARVHGGATSIDGRSADEPGFAAKSTIATAQKAAVAAAAAALVGPGDSVALSGGTTTVAVARALATVPDLTIVTNSLPVAQLMYEQGRPNGSVVLTGGVRTPSDALVGPVADAGLRDLHVDHLFLGVHGVDERAGLTTPNLVECATNRALMACARQTVVVTDSSKWGVVGLSSIARLEGVSVLVIDDALNAEARQVLSSRVGRLVLVSVI